MSTPSQFLDLDDKVRNFAQQIAMEVDEFEGICKAFDLSVEEGHELTSHPNFKQYLANAKSEWTAAHNATTRAEIKAAIAAENAIPEIYAHIHNRSASDTSKIEAFKALGKLGRVGERLANGGSNAGTAETVKIVINLGQDRKVEIEKPKPIIELSAEHTS